MTEMALSRSKAKHPPDKTVTEANRIKSRVTNSNRKEQNMAIRTKKLEDLPPLARKYVEENEGGMMLTAAEDRPATPAEMRSLEVRLEGMEREREADKRQLLTERDQRIASEIDAKATSLMNSEKIDYSAAVRRVVADGEHFLAPEESAPSGESLAEAVERRMKADPANYPDELGKGDQVGSVHSMAADDYQAQMREAMEKRGYGDD